jgi:hypothetical protein
MVLDSQALDEENARHKSSQPYLKSNSLVLKKFKIGTKASGSRSIKIFQKYKELIRSDCTS